MCLIAFAWRAHPRYDLVVAANRDEFYARPTAPADWWPGDRVVAGRDLSAGGTWMGATRDGRFAALTNYRDPGRQRGEAPSRGDLVRALLEDAGSPTDQLAALASRASDYNGFNLIGGTWHPDATRRELSLLAHPGDPRPVPIPPGIHALSNAQLNTPWPKVRRASDALSEALSATDVEDAFVDGLFTLLADRTIAVDADLPATGIPHDLERALSASFIALPHYGTRTSTVFLVDREGRATFVERNVEPDRPNDTRRFDFRIEAT